MCLVGGVGCTHIHCDALVSCLCWWFVLGRLMGEGERRGRERRGRGEEVVGGGERKKCCELVISAVGEWLEIREELEKEREGKRERGSEGGKWEEMMDEIDFSVSKELKEKLFLTLSLSNESKKGGEGLKKEKREEEEREEVINDEELSLLVRESIYGQHFAIHSIDALCLSLLFLIRCGEEPERCLCEVIIYLFILGDNFTNFISSFFSFPPFLPFFQFIFSPPRLLPWGETQTQLLV